MNLNPPGFKRTFWQGVKLSAGYILMGCCFFFGLILCGINPASALLLCAGTIILAMLLVEG